MVQRRNASNRAMHVASETASSGHTRSRTSSPSPPKNVRPILTRFHRIDFYDLVLLDQSAINLCSSSNLLCSPRNPGIFWVILPQYCGASSEVSSSLPVHK